MLMQPFTPLKVIGVDGVPAATSRVGLGFGLQSWLRSLF